MFGVPIKKILLAIFGSFLIAFLVTLSNSLKHKSRFGSYLHNNEFFGIDTLYIGFLLIFIVLFILVLSNMIMQNKKVLANSLFVVKTKTGFSSLIYPIIGLGGDRAEPVGISDYDEYKNEYLIKQGKLGAKNIIDSNLITYKVIKKKERINIDEQVEYEDLEKGDITTLEIFKKKILKDIKEIDNSCYDGLEDEIANTQSIPELVSALNKGAF